MLRRSGFLALGLALVFGSTTADAACPADADPAQWIEGGGTCLVVSVAGAKDAGSSSTLVVLVHGDGSDGGPTDYLYPFARSIAGIKPRVVAAALLRPGYSDKEGRTSQGSHHNRRDSYTAQNVTAVGKAIAALKARYKATRVVAVGHSGGAAITGVLIGRQPGLIDAAVLVSCPCDIARWRSENNRGAWPNSLSPQTFTATVPKSTTVVAITGADDTNTRPDLAKAYVSALAARGVRADARTVPGAGHGFGSLAPAVAAAIRDLL
jgi:pimeloyl-ACP methyl ester carboxylesterase